MLSNGSWTSNYDNINHVVYIDKYKCEKNVIAHGFHVCAPECTFISLL